MNKDTVGGKIDLLLVDQKAKDSFPAVDFNEVFLNLFQSEQLGIAFSNPEGNIVSSNEKFVTHFGGDRNINLFKLIKSVPARRHTPKLLEFSVPVNSHIVKLCQLSLRQNTGKNVVLWTSTIVSLPLPGSEPTKDTAVTNGNAQMEKFLYSASHDLRSPLTSIVGLVNLLRIESSDLTVLDYAMKIEQCASRLDSIVKDILNFSKTIYQPIHYDRVEFEPMLWKLIHSQYNDPNFKRISFEVKVEGNTPFYSDTDRLEIILENIIRNTVVFFDTNKVKPFVRICVSISCSHASIEIIDNGIGIARPHLENVFNMFYKGSDRSRGSGLGLYIVKESAAQLNVTMQLESEIGFGSVFRLTVPNTLTENPTGLEVEPLAGS